MVFRFLGQLAMVAKRGEWSLVKPLLHTYRDLSLGRNQRENYEWEDKSGLPPARE